jgi:hypothetical protein
MKKALILFVILTAVSSSCPAPSDTNGRLARAAASGQADSQVLQQKAVEIQQKAAELEKKQIDIQKDIQRKIKRGVTPGPAATPTLPVTPYIQVTAPAPKREPARVLVIPSPGMKGEEIAAIREDLSIMSRILDRKTGLSTLQVLSSDDRSEALMLFAVSQNSSEAFGQSATESIYIAGFGVLFSMKVDFPLLPPPESQEQKKGDKDTDNLWEQTKKEIYSPGTNAAIGSPFPRRQIRKSIYDADKVEELKAKLIESLKHAANIKSLRPDEWIVIAVTGQSNQPYTAPEEAGYGGFGMGGGYGFGMGGYGGDGYDQTFETEQEEISTSAPAGAEPEHTGKKAQYYTPTVMTIRVKKGDVDEFAKGSLTVEKLKQKLEITTY